MTINNYDLNSLPSDDEIDLREVLAAFRRRWIWVVSGGLLGLGIAAAGVLISKANEQPSENLRETMRMVIDTSQSPCAWTQKIQKYEPSNLIIDMGCRGEFWATRKDLATLASDEFESDGQFLVRVSPLTFGNKKDKDFAVSETQIELVVEARPSELDGVKASLENIKNLYAAKEIDKARMLSSNVQLSSGWISIEEVPRIDEKLKSEPYDRYLALGLLGGLVSGSCAALIADRRSNRVFSHSRILSQLGCPLWLTLPSLPWSDQVEGPLIGQLAVRLDRSLEWRVLSIAYEHEAVGPLAQALTRQNEPELSCKAVAPLLNSIIRFGSNSHPIGLLVVVESGFNSSQALEDARLVLSQLSCVKSIGIVLAGVPLPSELLVGEKTSL